MKRYSVTVNGVVYDVAVEELDGAAAPAPKAAPVAGGKPVNAPMPGNILAVNVKVGDKVEKGAVLCILEAMKMENEIMAPEAGTVAAVNVTKGATVQSGDVLVTLS